MKRAFERNEYCFRTQAHLPYEKKVTAFAGADRTKQGAKPRYKPRTPSLRIMERAALTICAEAAGVLAGGSVAVRRADSRHRSASGQ